MSPYEQEAAAVFAEVVAALRRVEGTELLVRDLESVIGTRKPIASAGKMEAMADEMIEAVEKAFRDEAASMSGNEMVERAVHTNAILRTAWPFTMLRLKRLRTRVEAYEQRA